MKVHTTESSSIIHISDTIQTVNNRANVWAERKNENLSIVAMTDSVTKTIEIKPRNSFLYWANILYTFGIGMLVDMNNPKRYSYPSRIYINSADTIDKYYRYSQSDNKGEWHLHLSLPWVNLFSLKPQDETYKVNAGCWGILIGFDYYHSTNKFFNLGASGVMDFFVPFPAAVDLYGEHEWMSSWYFSFSNNHKMGRFSVGYGLSYGKNSWALRDHGGYDPSPPPLTRDPVTKSHYALGLVFPAYFQCTEHFNMGLVYRPTFYRPFLLDKFTYEHLISIDFAWKLRIKK
ncbi:hypothetical protein FACS1894201_09790 [Bacteroidia bacterium]|nr:hypothetical protein FACS1894201_09790 [Bacteroidia bacterium]